MCVNRDCRFAGALLAGLQVASKPLDFQVCDIEQIKSDWGSSISSWRADAASYQNSTSEWEMSP
jgi:hypothetical protein